MLRCHDVDIEILTFKLFKAFYSWYMVNMDNDLNDNANVKKGNCIHILN